MKTNVMTIAMMMCAATPVFAQLNIPSDGSDGVLNITSNTVFDLSQAVTGNWNDNNAGNAGKGIYDSNKWAVVFKYKSVNIAAGTTNTFKNHPSRAPVVWLVQSNATVGGVIDLTGQRLLNSSTNAEPGPGGFRGGANNAAFGIGLGLGGTYNSNATFSSSYGNTRLVPLIGGSGVMDSLSGPFGIGGGGAILLAAGSNVTVTGTIQSKGFNGAYFAAGGGIRIVAGSILGNGNLIATPEGRLRLEANYMAPTLATTPVTPRVAPDSPPVIWPSAGSPGCRIVSVGGENISSDPRADISSSPDAVVGASGPVDVVLQTVNFPTSGVVQVRISPKLLSTATWVSASVVSGNVLNATWKATMTLSNGYSVLQARAYSP